jgi:methyl-accepting chemotaxis protein
MAGAANFFSQKAYTAMTDKSLRAFQEGVRFIVNLRSDDLAYQANLVSSLPETLALAGRSDPEAARALSELVKKEPFIDFLAILDKDGKPTFTYFGPNAPQGLDVGSMSPVAPAPKAVPNSTFPGFLDLAISTPLNGPSGQRAGTMVASNFAFQDAFMDDVKKVFQTEFTVFLGDTRASTTIVNNGRRSVGTRMDNPVILDTVLRGGKDFVNQNVIFGQVYDTIYWPMFGAGPRPLGMFYLGQPATVSHQAQRHFLASLTAILVIVTILILVVSKLVIGSINKVLFKIGEELSENFERVSNSANEMLASSESLADGSEAQAASIREAVTALESMSQMTGQSRENAKKTKSSNEEANRHISQGGELTAGMMGAMSQIEDSTTKIEAITKTIDDISFQTNLLALNAAVEAARAGEAGAGFAVVAEEVRNLSMRSTEAAKTIHDLISASVSKVAVGVKIVRQLDDCFQKIQNGAQEVSALIEMIAGATEEQARGTQLAESSVESVSEVADRNRKQAKSSTDSSRELGQAAESLNNVIEDLSTILEGRKKNGRPRAALPPGGHGP